jgi:hypothetical protein
MKSPANTAVSRTNGACRCPFHKKVGSTSTDRKFRLEGDVVVFQKKVPEITYPRLDPETYNDAKIMVPGYDVYYLEQEWREMWVDTGMPLLHNPDKAFVAFCKSWAKRKPMG